MKIAFVTACLEAGQNGVGDYTRTLADECVRQGHVACLLSIAEPQPKVGGCEESLSTKRLTLAEWRSDGGRVARQWLEDFQPDWTSFQFVPYGLHPRGLFRATIPALLHTLAPGGKRHLFFHELWIGSQAGADFKSRVMGWWQRRAIMQLLRGVAPRHVHTSNGYYQAALASIGQPAPVLRMMGSVPLPSSAGTALDIAGLPASAFVCGHFGTLHHNWCSEDFLSEFTRIAREARRPAAVVAVGSLGYGAALFARLAAKWSDRIRFIPLGSRPAEELARVFQRFDFAVTSVPWNIVGKSSSAAALREHGLRVVVTAHGSPPRFAERPWDDAAQDAGFVPFFREGRLLEAGIARTAPRPGVNAVARQFLADLDVTP